MNKATLFLCFLWSISPAFSQSVPFPVSPLKPIGVVNLSYLNEVPAGKSGFVTVKGSDFLDGAKKPLRFWGINTTGEAGLPSKTLAPVIAKWLAAQGFNMVRLHFLDRDWGKGGLLRYPGNSLDPEALDRLDFFQAELKNQGIYVNLNLHVGRTYPGSNASKLGDFSKGLDQFYRPYILELKSYAKEILTHKNPYTGLEWRKDPALALVEVNNENSLLSYTSTLVQNLKDPHRKALKDQWVSWIKTQYSTTESFNKAFSSLKTTSPQKDFPKIDFNQWSQEQHQGAQATWKQSAENFLWSIQKPGTQDWHLQMNRQGFTWNEGLNYRFTFEAKSPQGLTLQGSLMNSVAPWDYAGIEGSWTIDATWKTYTLEGKVNKHFPKGRINLGAGTKKGEIYLRNPSLEILEDIPVDYQNLDFPTGRSPVSYVKAFETFLVNIDRSYAREMHNFLKDDLGVKSPIANSQADYGGRDGFLRENDISDWIDMHSYHDHPWFPGKQWDEENWLISNKPLDESGGALARTAFWRAKEKPFIVSEWNIPSPNEYRLSTLPAAAIMGSLQNWSGVCLYTLSDFDQNYRDTTLKGFFNLYMDPSKTLLMPWAALAFRLGLIEPLANWKTYQATALPFDNEVATLSQTLRWKVGVSSTQPGGSDLGQAEAFPLSGPKESRGLWWVWGNLKGTYQTPIGQIKITGWSEPRFPWGGLFMVSLDQQSLLNSRKVLLISLSKALNQDAQWNQERTSLGKRWGRQVVSISGPLGGIVLKKKEWKISVLDGDYQVKKLIVPENLSLPYEQGSGLFLLER